MNTARCLFSRSKRFEQPRKALAPAGGWACPPKSGSLVNLRCLCHKEDELKQLKSELAALDRKIQLELAPPATETAEKETEGQQQARPTLGDVTQVRGTADGQHPAGENIADRFSAVRPGFQPKDEHRMKGIKM